MTTSLALPPGPSTAFFGFPLLRRMRHDYLGHAEHLHATYGDAVYARIGPERTFEFFHPDWVREVLVDHARSFIRWERGTRVFAEVHGQSVLVTEGATWQRQRRMLQPGFGPKRMAAYAQLMVAAAGEALDALPDRSAQTLDFEPLMTQLTMDVVLRTLYSHGVGPDGRAEAQAAAQPCSGPRACPTGCRTNGMNGKPSTPSTRWYAGISACGVSRRRPACRHRTTCSACYSRHATNRATRAC